VILRKNQQVVLGIVGHAAPIHAADVSWNDERALDRRRSEDASCSQMTDLVTTPFPVCIVDAPGIVSAHLLWRDGGWLERKWLCGGGRLAGDITLRNSALFHSEHRLSGFTIQDEEISGL
jgi:hypothetical protein